MDYLRTHLGTFCADEDELEAHFIAAHHGTRSRGDVLSSVVRLLQA